MKRIDWTFPNPPETGIRILPLADLHIGSPECRGYHARELLEYVRDNPNTYTVLLGDLMDAALRDSVSDIYGAKLNPGEEIRMIADLLRPLAEANKILGAIDGNHERRVSKQVGISPTQMICDILGIPHLYSPDNLLITLYCPETTYTIYGTHGSGGGKVAGSKMNSLVGLAKIIDADIYVAGHTHQPIVSKQAYNAYDPKTGKTRIKQQLFVNTASCLKYGGYGEIAGYSPTSCTYPEIWIDPYCKDMCATL